MNINIKYEISYEILWKYFKLHNYHLANVYVKINNERDFNIM